MAKNDTIDELRLDISVSDDNSAEKVIDLAYAISCLQEAIIKFQKTKLGLNLKGISAAAEKEIKKTTSLFNTLSKKIEASQKNIQSTKPVRSKIIEVKQSTQDGKPLQAATKLNGENLTKLEINENALNLAEIKTQTDLWEARLKNVNEKLAQGNLTEKKHLSLLQQKFSLSKKIEASQKKQSLFGKSNLLSSIGRVATYRAIRSVLKGITSSISVGFAGIAQKSKEFNNSMSGLKSSFSKLGASLSVGLYQFVIMLSPAVEKASNAFVEFFNRVSIGLSQLRGQKEAILVNTEYWENYSKSVDKAKGSLLSFDTFTTLSQSSDATSYDPDKMFQAVDLEGLDTGTLNSDLTTTKTLLTGISIALGAITATKVISGLTSIVGKIKDFSSAKNVAGDVSTLGKSLLDTSGKSINLTKDIGNLTLGLSLVGLGIYDLIASWNDANFESWEKAVVITTAAMAGLATAIIAVNAGLNWIKAASVTAAVVGAVAIAGTELAKWTKPKTYADGGMFEGAGTMFAVAGESGAEVVSRGTYGTGVLNVQQFKEAMFMALYEYGAARGDFSDISVSMDGKKVGQITAKSAYNEMKRQGLLRNV